MSEKLAAFDKKAAAAKAAADIDYYSLLKLDQLPSEHHPYALRDWRIRGVDDIVKQLKKTLKPDEASAFTHYLKQCPRIDDLTNHLLSHPETQALLDVYIAKLHRKYSK